MTVDIDVEEALRLRLVEDKGSQSPERLDTHGRLKLTVAQATEMNLSVGDLVTIAVSDRSFLVSSGGTEAPSVTHALGTTDYAGMGVFRESAPGILALHPGLVETKLTFADLISMARSSTRRHPPDPFPTRSG